jgi:hypothetical protein
MLYDYVNQSRFGIGGRPSSIRSRVSEVRGTLRFMCMISEYRVTPISWWTSIKIIYYIIMLILRIIYLCLCYLLRLSLRLRESKIKAECTTIAKLAETESFGNENYPYPNNPNVDA